MSELDAHQSLPTHARNLREFFAYLNAHRRSAEFAQSEVIDSYVARLDHREILALIAAIDSLLRRNESDAMLSAQLREFGLTDVPVAARGSVRDWLRDLRHQLAQ